MYLETQTYVRINTEQGLPYSRLKSQACGTHFVKIIRPVQVIVNSSGKLH